MGIEQITEFFTEYSIYALIEEVKKGGGGEPYALLYNYLRTLIPSNRDHFLRFCLF